LLNISVIREGKKTQEIGTEKGTVFIGRDASCDVVLDDRTTSRRHASVTVQEDGVYLEDLDSRNGTFIDGKAVKRHKLSGDDVIQIGDYQISVGGHAALTRKIKRADDDRPTETAIISKIDALSVSKGQDIREGVVDEKAMAKRLAALYNLGHELCGQLSVSEITGTFLDVVFEVFTKADRSIVLLEDRDTHNLVPVAARERGTSSADITVSQTIIDMVLEEKHAVICGDTSSDARFKHSASLQDLKIKSIMCVPLLVSDQVLGMAEVDSSSGGIIFREDDLRLLTGLAAQASIALENSRLYREIGRSKRLAAIGQTVSGVAHCVKNVLNGIDGGLFIARRGLDTSNEEKVAKGWDMLERNSSFLKGLVLDMLDYSKDRPPEYDSLDLNELFGEIMAFVEGRAAEGEIELTVDIDSGIGSVQLDPTRMKRALLNIVANAIEATPRGGKVSVAAAGLPGGMFLVTIADTGKGIPQDILKTIFEPFYSTKGSKGTGLGLPVMKKIVEEHGGQVELESVEGEGTTFKITLPVGGVKRGQTLISDLRK
jgi:signal transduction histidine kinase